MRIKIIFDNLTNLWSMAPQRSWLFVQLNEIRTVADLANMIIVKFGVPNNISTQLYLDGCLLPSWENAQVVHENDEIWLVPEIRRTTEITFSDVLVTNQEEGDAKQDRKKKKRKRKYSEDDQVTELHESPAVVPKSQPDVCVLEIVSQSATSGESEMESVAIKSVEKKTNFGQNVTSCQADIVQNLDDITVSSANKKAKIDDFTCTDTVNRAKNDDEKISDKVENADGYEANMSALDLAIKNTLATIQSSVGYAEQSKVVKVETGEVPKKRRKRVRKNKKSKAADSEWTPVEPKTKSFEIKASSNQVDWNVGYKVNNYGPKHMKFNDSDHEEEATQEQSSIQEQNVEQISAQVEVKSDQKSLPSKSCESVNESSTQLYSQRSTHYEHTPKKTSLQTRVKKQTNDNTNTKSLSTPSKDGEIRTFQKGPFANVQVFSRKQTKMNKKAAFVPLTKEEQLNTVASNKSCIYQNTEFGSTEFGVQPEHAEAVEEEDLDAVELLEDDSVPMQAENDLNEDEYSDHDIPPPPPKDYSGCPILQGAPRVGDCIAYKIIEMNENYCPVLSEYKEANVLSFDSKTQNLRLGFTSNRMSKKMGRFDVVIEDEDGNILTNTDILETEVTVPLSSIVEPRLVTA